jgi:hypothetical protein
MKVAEMDDKEAEQAGQLIEDLLTDLQLMELDPDMAAYLFLSTGMTLLMSNNPDDPAFVTYLHASAMAAAAASASEMRKDAEQESGRTEH